LLLQNLMYGVKIEKKSETLLDQKKEFIQRGWYISVTETDRLYLIDNKAQNIKLYDNSGSFIDIARRKGFGPQEVASPTSIDYFKGKMAVGDSGKNRLLLYEVEKAGLIESKEITATYGGFDIKMFGNRLFVSSSKSDPDGKIYGLFSIDIVTEKIDYLIPFHQCYGFSSYKELISKIYDQVNIIGRYCYIDADDQYAYLCWQGDLKVLAVNLQTKKVTTFGNKTKNYNKPMVTKKIQTMYKARSPELYLEDRKFSYLTGLFIDKSFIAVLYANYRDEAPGWQTHIQIYSRNGQFIKEQELPGGINNDNYPLKVFYYSKDTDTLYFLKKTIDKALNDVYCLVKYHISQ